MALQPGGPADVAALLALAELAPALLVVHQLEVASLRRLVREGHVAVAPEVLPHVPLHVVPVRVDLNIILGQEEINRAVGGTTRSMPASW